jgi:thiosulfate/3-mercaptopyruvate sulfurtransferase
MAQSPSLAPEGPLVSTGWLADHLGDPGLRILDATWRMPADQADPKGDFGRERIPGAAFFDIDAIADHSTGLPHMAPSEADFSAAAGALGIGDGDTVVIYDQLGVFSAPRAWWTFRLFGHDRVFVLDGGLPKWRAEGRPLDNGPAVSPEPARFTARKRPELVRDLEQVRAMLEAGAQVVDARGGARFRGEAPEPRASLRGGHMPGALNLPFGDLFESGGVLAGPDALASRYRAAGLDLDRPVTATCGSGLTAAILALGLARLGHWDASVYDGSWTEWGGRSDTPVVKG